MSNKLNTISAIKTNYSINDFVAFNPNELKTGKYASIVNNDAKVIIEDPTLLGHIESKNSEILNKCMTVSTTLLGSNNEYNMPVIFSDIYFNNDNSFNIDGKNLYVENNYVVSGDPELYRLFSNTPSFFNDKNLWKSIAPIQTALSRKYCRFSFCIFTIINRWYKYFLVKIISR
jgi:hypothetical protein